MGQGLLGEGELQVMERGVDRVERVADPEAEVERHLVVARACRMEPAGRVAR